MIGTGHDSPVGGAKGNIFRRLLLGDWVVGFFVVTCRQVSQLEASVRENDGYLKVVKDENRALKELLDSYARDLAGPVGMGQQGQADSLVRQVLTGGAFSRAHRIQID